MPTDPANPGTVGDDWTVSRPAAAEYPAGGLDRLLDALCDTDGMSDDECRAELREHGIDADAAVERLRQRFWPDATDNDPWPDAPTDEPAPVPGDEGVRFDQSRGFGAIDPGPTFDLVGIPGSLEGRWALNVARLGDEDDGDPGVGALPGARRE